MSTAFCITCGCSRNIRKEYERVEIEVRGIKISCVEAAAVCEACGQEVYVPEINDENAAAREAAYRQAAGLITVDEIRQIMQKYQIGAGPLARVMGFGEITVTRYLDGGLPSKTNSDRLLQVLASPEKMGERLEANRDRITGTAYRKCREALDRLKNLYGTEKIEVVTRYLLKNMGEVTPLALQKILYYVQAFFYALYNEEIFTAPCQAWAHGPVYPNVYQKYKAYGYNPIEPPELDVDSCLAELTERETGLIDAVIASFGQYSGPALEKMTHSERPWKEARGNLLPGDRSARTIRQDTIHEYFAAVVETCHIVNPCDIANYSSDLFKKG